MRRTRLSRFFIAPEVDLFRHFFIQPMIANVLPELLMAQGVIARHDVGAGNETREGSEVNKRKRAREDRPPGPSKRRARPTVKKEEKEEIFAISQQIQVLQVSGANYMLLRLVAPDGFAW
jgi:hypothetical protein